MTPMLIFFGILFGRWWLTAVLVATIAWPVMLLSDGLIETPGQSVAAAGVALVATSVGAAIHQLARALVHVVRNHHRPATPSGSHP